MAKRLLKGLPELISILQDRADELKDPACSKCCPDCIYTVSQILTDGQMVDAACQPPCHDFWNACITAVTRPHSDEDIATLQKTLRANAARCPARNLHCYDLKTHNGELEEPVHRFFHSLYLCLHYCLYPREDRSSALFSASGPKKTFGNKHGRWPLHPNDLIPLGARQSAEMHIHWCYQLFSPATVSYLEIIIIGCRSLVFPHVLESPLRERLAWCLVQMLNADTARDAFPWPATAKYGRPARPSSWLCASNSVVLAAGLIRTICDGPDDNSDDMTKLCRGFEVALLPALNNALDLVRRGAAADCDSDALCNLAIQLHQQHPLGELHVLVQARQLSHTSVNPSSLGPTKALLGRRYSRRTCCGPSCSNGIPESQDGKPLALCSRCKFTQYCCKRCQMADWKRVIWPHKALCPMLGRLRPVLEKDTSEFEEVLLSLDFEKIDVHHFMLWLKD